MTINARQLAQAAVANTTSTLYTVPTGTTTYVKDFDACNTTANAINLNIHIVPSGANAATTNALYYNSNVAANTTFHWTGTQIMTAGMTLQAKGSAVGITLTVSGGEET